MYCEDYPCCGHTPQDPCDSSPYDPWSDPHLGCDHNAGYCYLADEEEDDEYQEDEYQEDDDLELIDD